MSLLDNIQNYYETLVLESLAKQIKGQEYDEDVLTDVLCIAINHLPPRYIRHEVDFLYYMSPIERQEIEIKAEKAVKDALEYIKNKNRS
jgi:competence protein ComFB